MRFRWLGIFLLVSLPQSAEAAKYYFSDCGAGFISGYPGEGEITRAQSWGVACDHGVAACQGAFYVGGSQGNPYCLDPLHSGTFGSFAFLADGVGLELAPGDVVNLCAGRCDGSGVARYVLDGIALGDSSHNYCFGETAAFVPRVAGTNGAHITIQAMPGETVILTGDHDQNGVPSNGDLDHIVSTCADASSGGVAFYDWKNLIFERTLRGPISSVGYVMNDWTFDGVEVRRTGGGAVPNNQWNDESPYDSGCTVQLNGANAYCVNIGTPGITTNFTFKNGSLHHCCNMGFRITTNPSATALLFDNNEVYAESAATNDFQSRNETYQNNNVHDNDQGITIEDRESGVVIQDNLIHCDGIYRANTDAKCTAGILVDDGDLGQGGTTHDITIRRNRIFGQTSSTGKLDTGILYWATCTGGCVPGTNLIENNMIWSIDAPASGGPAVSDRGQGIDIRTASPITLRNNTVHQARWPLYLETSSGAVTHVVTDNLFSAATGTSVVTTSSAAAGSTFNNNNVWSGSKLATTAGATTQFCADLNASGTIGTGTTSGNFCSAPGFVNVTDSSAAAWNLRLSSMRDVDVDKATSGAATDIDGRARPYGTKYDIGASEMYPLSLVCRAQPGRCIGTTAGQTSPAAATVDPFSAPLATDVIYPAASVITQPAIPGGS